MSMFREGENQAAGESPYEPAQRPRPISVQLPVTTPTVSYILLGLTILVFVLQLLSQSTLGYDLPAAIGMKIDARIVSGELWRLVTPVLLHGSIMHVAFNMYALFYLGPSLERFFGHWRFLALYLVSGFAGNVFSFAFTPEASLGSSTAIFGLLAAQGVFLVRNRELFGARARGAITQIIFIAAINLFIGLSPGIDNWGHVGGMLAGLLFSALAAPVLSIEGIPPNLHFADQREARDTLLATLLVAAIFSVMAGFLIISRQ